MAEGFNLARRLSSRNENDLMRKFISEDIFSLLETDIDDIIMTDECRMRTDEMNFSVKSTVLTVCFIFLYCT